MHINFYNYACAESSKRKEEKKRSVQAVEINLGKKSFIMHKPSSRLHDCYNYSFS